MDSTIVFQKRKLIHLLWVLLPLSCLLLGGLFSPTAAATQIVVDSLADELQSDDNCTLREALLAANVNLPIDNCAGGSNDEPDIISFAVEGTIFLNNSLAIGRNIVIQGSGQDKTIIDGKKSLNIIELLDVGSGEIVLRDLTIQNGSDDTGMGGGIKNEVRQTLVLDGIKMQGNTADTGGAIAFNLSDGGQLSIQESHFFDNSAVSGGAIFIESDDCDAGFLIENSLFQENDSAVNGAAINVSGCPSGTIRHSTFSDNESLGSAGALYQTIFGQEKQSQLVFTNSTLTENEKGAVSINANNGASISVQFFNSTFVKNNLYNVVLNGVDAQAEAIFSNSLVVNAGDPNCTFFSNQSISFKSLGYNLTDGNDCNFNEATDQVIAPLFVTRTLGALGDNGGLTPTIALYPGSAAIDAGDCSGNNVMVDQRGVERPQGEACDIGAFEYVHSGQLFLPIILP